MLRRAAGAERRALMRLDVPLQDLPAQAVGRFVHVLVGEIKPPLGVKRRVSCTQAETARRNFPDAPPLAWHDAKNLAH